MTGFLIACQFLTRLPVPLRAAMEPAQMGHSMRWFPLVGALIGVLVAGLDAALGLVLGEEVRAVVLVVALAALTGGLHLDGLMDSCDGLFSVAAPARRLEIMRDSRVGSFAVIGLTTLLLLKYAALLSLPGPLRLGGLIAMGAISRWTMVYASVCYPSARSDGLGSAYKAAAGRNELLIATLLVLILISSLGFAGWLALLLALPVAITLAQYALGKIGGLTGDTYGAICEVSEVSVVIVLPLAVSWLAPH
jgi:adenosylcobinamide-GDP ribazoletransferase